MGIQRTGHNKYMAIDPIAAKDGLFCCHRSNPCEYHRKLQGRKRPTYPPQLPNTEEDKKEDENE